MVGEHLPQIVPPPICLQCEVCCRYLSPATIYVPYFFPEEIKDIHPEEGNWEAVGSVVDCKSLPIAHGGGYICRFFVPQENKCRIYPRRPLDCRLYPFMVTYAEDYQSVVLALDTKCPYARENTNEVKSYVGDLLKALDNPPIARKIIENRNFISDFQEDTVPAGRLENLSGELCFPALGLRRISLKDKDLFDDYFAKRSISLSAFAFNLIYIWGTLLHILWKEIGGEPCVFAGNEQDYFLFLPPESKEAIEESLRILDGLNGKGNPASRIENVPAELVSELAQLGLKMKAGAPEYLYSREKLAGFKGNAFKSKRALVNNFLRNNPVERICSLDSNEHTKSLLFPPLKKGGRGDLQMKTRGLQEEDIGGCLNLYREWARQRLDKESSDYSRALIEDSYFAQKTALMNMRELRLEGLVVELNGTIVGYTLGFPLNKRIFVNLFETAGLTQKGLPQFIFRELACTLARGEYINALSDSGLENLRRVKESYHPARRLEVWTAYMPEQQKKKS